MNQPILKLSLREPNSWNNTEIYEFLDETSHRFNIIKIEILEKSTFLIIYGNFISMMNFIYFIKEINYFEINFVKEQKLINLKNKLFSNKNNIIKEDYIDNKGIKYTCKFFINTNINHNYPIAKKIIGIKGINMKKILNNISNNSLKTIKLRLRGQGSGFKEGLEKKESNDDLHLCLSSEDNKTFYNSIFLIENLLVKIQKEYLKIYKSPNKIYKKYIEVFK